MRSTTVRIRPGSARRDHRHRWASPPAAAAAAPAAPVAVAPTVPARPWTCYIGSEHAVPASSSRPGSRTSANQFKAQTGATVKWETFASRQRRAHQDPDLRRVRAGPDIYGVGTTFTPTAYATGRLRQAGRRGVEEGRRQGQVPAGDARHLRSGPEQPGRHPVGQPPVRHGLQQGPAEGGRHRRSRRPRGTSSAQQAKKMTHGDQYGLAVAYKDGFDPWKFAWGMSIQAGNPIVDGKTAKIDDPTTKKAYETYFGWLTTDKVVNPAAVGWNEHPGARGVRRPARRRTSPMTTYTSSADAQHEPAQGQVRLRADADDPAGHDHGPPGRRRPRASSPATTSWWPSTPRTRTWRSPSSTC